jgi:hypothetical protein
MPGQIFSAANAALVAYGEVTKSGASATTVIGGVDSGVGQFTVNRTATGVVAINLPTGFGQADGRSLIFCQAYTATPEVSVVAVQTGSQQKLIYTYVGQTATDVDFGFMLFQNTLPQSS